MRPIFRAGGVHQDMPPGLAEDILKFCDHFLKVLDDIEGLLTENRIFKQRNVDIGIVTRAEAEMWGMSGVMLRSTGRDWDLRRSQPYECYNELDFQIPDRQERRQLRPLCDAHGRDARSPPRSCASASRRCRPVPWCRRTTRWCRRAAAR